MSDGSGRGLQTCRTNNKMFACQFDSETGLSILLRYVAFKKISMMTPGF